MEINRFRPIWRGVRFQSVTDVGPWKKHSAQSSNFSDRLLPFFRIGRRFTGLEV